MPVEGRTGVVIPVPAADPVLARTAAQVDGVRRDVPAHVSLLYPFAPIAELDENAHAALRTLFDRQTVVEVEFSRCHRQADFLFLRPRPLQPVTELVDLLRQRWPHVVPYGGLHGDQVEPHLTIAIGADAAHAAAIESLVSAELPLTATLREAWLVVAEDGQWSLRERFPFRAQPTKGRSVRFRSDGFGRVV